MGEFRGGQGDLFFWALLHGGRGVPSGSCRRSAHSCGLVGRISDRGIAGRRRDALLCSPRHAGRRAADDGSVSCSLVIGSPGIGGCPVASSFCGIRARRLRQTAFCGRAGNQCALAIGGVCDGQASVQIRLRRARVHSRPGDRAFGLWERRTGNCRSDVASGFSGCRDHEPDSPWELGTFVDCHFHGVRQKHRTAGAFGGSWLDQHRGTPDDRPARPPSGRTFVDRHNPLAKRRRMFTPNTNSGMS